MKLFETKIKPKMIKNKILKLIFNFFMKIKYKGNIKKKSSKI